MVGSKKEVSIIISGAKAKIRALGIAQRVIFTAIFLMMICNLLNLSAVLVLPLMEGFGLPAIEAAVRMSSDCYRRKSTTFIIG
jgi:hypothetical protein